MYILTVNGKENDGAYSVKDDEGEHILYLFEQEDDAVRFLTLLEADLKEKDLKWEVMEVDTDIIAMNCDNYGYNYAIITPDELMIPTLD